MTLALLTLALVSQQTKEQMPPDLSKEDRFAWCVSHDDFEGFKKALKEIGVNSPPTISGWATPLAYAVWIGQEDCVDYLLAQGAKPDGLTKWGMTPLMSAVNSFSMIDGKNPIIDKLLKSGADVNAKGKDGVTALHVAAGWPRYDFGWAGQDRQHAQMLAYLVSVGAKVDALDDNGMAPIHWAARQGHYESVVELLKLGARGSRRDKYDRTPLTFFVDWDPEGRAAKLLADAGAQLGPMEYVLMGKLDEAVAMLKGGTEKLAYGPKGESPLALAAATGRADLVEAIIPYKTDVNHVDDRGETAMLAATGIVYVLGQIGRSYSLSPSKNGSRERIVALLKSAGADASYVVQPETEFSLRAEGHTPLYRAVGTGSVDLVLAMLDAGANPNGSGELSPLALASSLRRLDIVKLLLERGANPSGGYPVRALFNGLPLVEEAKGNDKPADILAVLLAAKSTLKFPDQYGKSKELIENAAHYAVYDVECLRMVLDAGVDINQQDGYGETPLMCAVRYQKVDAVKLLLSRGADKSLKNVSGQDAMHFAKWRENAELIALLGG